MRAAPALLLLFALPVLLAGSEEEDLGTLRKKIQDTRREIEDLSGQESGILESLMKLDQDLSLTNRLLTGLESKRRQTEGRLRELEDQALQSEDELGRRKELLRKRLRALYQFGGYHEFEILLSSESLVELVTRFDRLLRIVRRDDILYRSVLAEKERLEQAQRELAAKNDEIRAIEEERSREKKTLLGRKGERQELLDDVRSRRESYERLVAEMEEASRELEKIIAARERGEEVLGPSLFDGGSAKLPWPVEGTVIQRFGRIRHPEFGTVVTNNGVDIQAPSGEEIRSVAPGRVEYVSTLPGYGNCIIIRHSGGYYTLYAHAAEILVRAGEQVEQGRVLATVGNTGSVSGSSLHFEIRKGTTPVDPLQWLR